MNISRRIGQTRVNGGCLFWLTFGSVYLSVLIMVYFVAGAAYGLWHAVRFLVRRFAR